MATKPEFDFKTFDHTSFEATKALWSGEAKAGYAFPPEVEQLMDWIETHMSPESGQAVACGVFQTGSRVADAVCEVVITRQSVRSKWVKMLRVRLRPKIDDVLNSTNADSSDAIREALDIFSKATYGLLNFGGVVKANTIKIYGRTRQQTDFLRYFSVELSKKKGHEFQLSMEGKFLVVRGPNRAVA